LEKFRQRSYIAGRRPNTPENLTSWILSPQEIDPKTPMPAVVPTREEARAIAEFLHRAR
jgi:cytochrome c